VTRSLKWHLVVAAVLVAVAVPLEAQTREREAVDSIFRAWDRPGSPGCALAVVEGGAVAYAQGYGYANLERGTPITPNGVFYIASVSKQLTAASIVLLALEGKISLDDDVRTYVPELPDYGQTITIRHLLNHTSGLRDYLTLMEAAGMSLEEEQSPENILALVARQEQLNFPPGTEYLYSNTGYFLIPIIIQRVTGITIHEYAAARLFSPLGMSRTRFHDDYRTPVDNRVWSYRPADDEGFELAFLEKFDQVGSGGVLTTVGDLALWDENLHTGTVGGEQLLHLMQTRGVLATGDTLDYALGLVIGTYKGLRTVSHGGSMMGFRTHLLRFPNQRLSVICLCNLANIDPGALARQVADVYLTDPLNQSLTPYGGRYVSAELGVSWTIRVDGSDLILERPGEDAPAELESQGTDAFSPRRGVVLEFERDAEDHVTGFRLNTGRANGIEFVRR
jgi:CubicO group peptidase (beta-lactamase class C family)